jgi:hypothetical protein
MGLICNLFGHKTNPQDYIGAAEGYHAVDGIGREHVWVEGFCDRCYIIYRIGNMHLPPRNKEKDLIRELEEARKLLDRGSDI